MKTCRRHLALAGVISIASGVAGGSAAAQIAVAAHDGHSVLVKGAAAPVNGPIVDNVAVLDISQFPPKIKSTVDTAASVTGPGQCVFVAKDESYAIVASANKVENNQLVPDNRVSVIDLTTNPPQVVQQLQGGAGTDCVTVSPDGTLAIVVNRTDGDIGLYSVKSKRLDPIGKVDLGNPKSAPGAVIFTTDGKNALVSRDDGILTVLNVDGQKVTIDATLLLQVPHGYPIARSPDGKLAAVAGSWGTNGDIGSVALVDLSSKPFRIVELARLPTASEGIQFSPDGKYLAVSSLNGSNRASDSPYYHDNAILTVFSVSAQTLNKVAEAPLGHWSQGLTFTADGKAILVQNMVEKAYSVFRFADGKLTAEAPLPVSQGSPSTIGVAGR